MINLQIIISIEAIKLKKVKEFISLIIAICFIFTSCETTKSLSDYNLETYSKNDYSDRKILGSVTVSKIDWVWASYNANDEKTIKLFERLKNKAKRKYGNDIELLDISIGDYQSSISVPLYVLGGAVFLGGVALCASSSEEKEISSSSKKTETEITNSGAYGAGMGLVLGSSFLYFFKGVKATAIVAKAEQKDIDYKLISESEIEANKRLATIAFIKKKQREELLNKISSLQEDLNECKTELETLQKEKSVTQQKINKRILDLGSPIAIISQNIDSVNSAGGVNCSIEFSNISDKTSKYVNFTVVPYNRVFDITNSEIDGQSEKIINITNIISPQTDFKAKWKNVWYNNTISSMKIIKIEIIYTDNSKISIDTQEKIDKCFYTSSELKELKDIDEKMKEIVSKVYDIGREVDKLQNNGR